jgi:hypothetical protein
MVINEFVTPIILVLCFRLCLALTSGVGTPTWCRIFLPNTTNPSTTIRWPIFIYSCTFDWRHYWPQLRFSRCCPKGWYFRNLNFLITYFRFHENPSSGCRVVARTDGRTKLMFLNLVFTIPECLQNSIKWSLPDKHTFYFVLNVLFGPFYFEANSSFLQFCERA